MHSYLFFADSWWRSWCLWLTFKWWEYWSTLCTDGILLTPSSLKQPFPSLVKIVSISFTACTIYFFLRELLLSVSVHAWRMDSLWTFPGRLWIYISSDSHLRRKQTTWWLYSTVLIKSQSCHEILKFNDHVEGAPGLWPSRLNNLWRKSGYNIFNIDEIERKLPLKEILAKIKNIGMSM